MSPANFFHVRHYVVLVRKQRFFSKKAGLTASTLELASTSVRSTEQDVQSVRRSEYWSRMLEIAKKTAELVALPTSQLAGVEVVR